MVSFEHLCCEECLVDVFAGVVPLCWPKKGKKARETFFFLFWQHSALLLADAHVYSVGGVCFFSGSALLAKASEEVVTKITITSLKQRLPH